MTNWHRLLAEHLADKSLVIQVRINMG